MAKTVRVAILLINRTKICFEIEKVYFGLNRGILRFQIDKTYSVEFAKDCGFYFVTPEGLFCKFVRQRGIADLGRRSWIGRPRKEGRERVCRRRGLARRRHGRWARVLARVDEVAITVVMGQNKSMGSERETRRPRRGARERP